MSLITFSRDGLLTHVGKCYVQQNSAHSFERLTAVSAPLAGTDDGAADANQEVSWACPAEDEAHFQDVAAMECEVPLGRCQGHSVSIPKRRRGREVEVRVTDITIAQ